MRLLRWMAVAVLVVLSTAFAPDPAGAVCAGPTFEYSPTEVAPGGTVTVTGTGFGDDCHDTGLPPASEGVLGEPLSDIEILLGQGGERELVATGSADEDYEFSVDVVVPASFGPGEIAITVSYAAVPRTSEPLVVSDARPVESLGAEVAMFGPPVESDHASGPTSESPEVFEETVPPIAGEGDDGSSPWVVVGAVLIGGLLVAAGWFDRRRDRRPTRLSRRVRA